MNNVIFLNYLLKKKKKNTILWSQSKILVENKCLYSMSLIYFLQYLQTNSNLNEYGRLLYIYFQVTQIKIKFTLIHHLSFTIIFYGWKTIETNTNKLKFGTKDFMQKKVQTR